MQQHEDRITWQDEVVAGREGDATRGISDRRSTTQHEEHNTTSQGKDYTACGGKLTNNGRQWKELRGQLGLGLEQIG